jgi:pimeloyl-ACP methyl ester carboxylesterase
MTSIGDATMSTFAHDGLSFHYRDRGKGHPFVFLHGLGFDLEQPFALFSPARKTRLIGLDFRAHGRTPLGDVKKISFASYADDLIALLDHLRIERAVVGGLSMGAGVALNVALRYPDRLLGLILVRPAWIDRALPENARVYPHIAQQILRHGPVEGLALFRQTPEFLEIVREAPHVAATLERQFVEPRAVECIARLERFPHDRPCREREDLATIRAPTLVLGNNRDPVHRWDIAVALAKEIPTARLEELTAPSDNLARFGADLQASIDAFLDGLARAG